MKIGPQIPLQNFTPTPVLDIHVNPGQGYSLRVNARVSATRNDSQSVVVHSVVTALVSGAVRNDGSTITGLFSAVANGASFSEITSVGVRFVTEEGTPGQNRVRIYLYPQIDTSNQITLSGQLSVEDLSVDIGVTPIFNFVIDL